MPSVAEAEPAEFAETAATLAQQIERFFRWGAGWRRISPCGPIGLSGTHARVPATVAALAWRVVAVSAATPRLGAGRPLRRSAAFDRPPAGGP
jgi:hypothetical protein